MSKLKQSEGFTLIELMIVVAIIAIIAAIAIPSILRSRISANETSAAGSLDSLTKSNQLFRQNDTDGDGVNNYWAADVYGLWAIVSTGGNRAELIGAGMANADYMYSGTFNPSYESSVDVWTTNPAGSAHPVPKSGYYFYMMQGEQTGGGGTCDQNYNGNGASTVGSPFRNTAKFAAAAMPDTYDSTGRKAYIVTAGGETYSIDAASANGTGSTFNQSSGPVTGGGGGGTVPVQCVPTQGDLSDLWSTK